MQVALSSSVRRKICLELFRSGNKETGGLLLAEQLDGEGRFRVVDVTVDPKGGDKDYFERRPELHAQALEAFFEKHGNNFRRFNYLGEWHSHPSFAVKPSPTDIVTMQAMVEDSGNIDFSVLMIVRLRMFVMMQVGTYIFMRGRVPQPVEMIDDPEP
ncbi:Mov34/MPN/PAD-1 family protein [uncultured Agrobacterium sp.]|uniref:Mov34/MPN/PAD-1 family protein n=1 Tax=uncultured Agrobacterium sp. TaxID=157277 RepID=UPI0025FE2C83|nr:Mov34/MPN/PAD-1 family protein [uncultured Agrobacterium sp.]